MASIESLIPLIYHEKQQPGSMLCAQHALNSLLQGNYFTAPDLSTIARNLDMLEATYDHDNRGRESMNMDDTGFFSVQVLENALQVWGLSLVRWRSEAMRPYQSHPHTQLAFILNLEQHWFTLRRFGRVSSDPSLEADLGDGHWFNVNSSLPAPERIGKLHLGMVLQQSEAEGYSVFAVVQTDPSGPLALPRTEADEIAAEIPEPSNFQSTSRRSTVEVPARVETVEGFEDEDMELQAALQASLAGPEQHFLPGGVFGHAPTASASASASAPAPAPAFDPVAVRTRLPFPPPVIPSEHGYELLGRQGDEDEEEDEDEVQEITTAAPREPLDPVQASIARNRAIMERMRREQEAALRFNYDDEAERVESVWQRAAAAAAGPRYNSRRPFPVVENEDGDGDEEDEEEMVRRAIEESAAMARTQHVSAPPNTAVPMVEDDEDDVPPLQTARTHRQMSTPSFVPPAAERVYDDDDAELQAALKASLESMPTGFRIPSPPPVRLPSREYSQPSPASASASASTPAPAPGAPPSIERLRSTSSTRDVEEESETESYVTAESSPVEQLSMEEIRRRRLARFGG